jgi:anti-sigma factor RsiW
MVHGEFTMLMSLVLDGEATGDEGARLREHLRSCDVCALTWQRWQELDRRFALAPVLPAPVNLAASVAIRLNARQAEQVTRRWLMLGLALAWSAVVVIVVLSLGMANGWDLQLAPFQGPLTAAWTGLTGNGGWLWRAALSTVGQVGAPVVAAAIGALLCLTCGLVMAWLWLVARLTVSDQGAFAPAK